MMIHTSLRSCGFTPQRPGFGTGTGRRPHVGTFCQLIAVGRWFSPGTPVSSTSETDISLPS